MPNKIVIFDEKDIAFTVTRRKLLATRYAFIRKNRGEDRVCHATHNNRVTFFVITFPTWCLSLLLFHCFHWLKSHVQLQKIEWDRS